ncbi:ECF transporter S component [Gudongella sp. DL1XJH-153]|uniref:ECF transporter S component n=1 Tax=Gudongella sp. DL1XJH-153 TaxID=3409804 RepID=UPI003BB67292
MNTRKIVMTGMFIALGIVLPIAFHSFNMGGPVFLPMHIPVLMAGLTLGPLAGLFTGMITPILSSVLTGMPPMFPMLPIMIFELGVYGLTSGFIAREYPGKIFFPLIAGMIDGRVAAAIVVFVLATFFGVDISPWTFIKGAIVTGVPGILIQLVIIPPLVKAIRGSTGLQANRT